MAKTSTNDSEIMRLPEGICPTGVLASGHITPGRYRALAMYGWIGVHRSGVPLVVLSLSVLRNIQDRMIGDLTHVLPVHEMSRGYVLDLLRHYGWDGRVWPHESGWPDGSAEETLLGNVLTKHGLLGLLTFPPQSTGQHRVVAVDIAKRSGPFRLAPKVESLEDLQDLGTRFDIICRNPYLLFGYPS